MGWVPFYAWLENLTFLLLIFLSAPFFGGYVARIASQKKLFWAWMDKSEDYCCRFCGVNPQEQMEWTQYVKALLIFNFLGLILLFLLVSFQHLLPLNPLALPGVPLLLAFNIAISFATNTDWQSYASETTLSNFSQMIGLTVQNFLSAATGLTVFFVLARGFMSSQLKTLGNFWKDLIRCVLFLLLPMAFVLALLLIQQGVVQTLNPPLEIETMENFSQVIPLGPVASQVAIKQLGTNGGGFFTANSAHPFENPTPITNILEMLAILLIPSCLCFAYGAIVESRKHGVMIFFVMLFFLAASLAVALSTEFTQNPLFDGQYLMEGKERRHGIAGSVLWDITAAALNGSSNASLASMEPLTGGVALSLLLLKEAIFGSLGVGLCSMVMFILLTVFLCGFLAGKRPEYLGKKIEKKEIQWALAALAIPPICILTGLSLSLLLSGAATNLEINGPHALTQLLYNFSSISNNNGSSFAGLNTNNNFFNTLSGILMLICRLAIIVPSLAIAGSLAEKKIIPKSYATLDTSSLIFAVFLTAVILFIGALIFFPFLALGPVLEHMLMLKGKTF